MWWDVDESCSSIYAGDLFIGICGFVSLLVLFWWRFYVLNFVKKVEADALMRPWPEIMIVFVLYHEVIGQIVTSYQSPQSQLTFVR